MDCDAVAKKWIFRNVFLAKWSGVGNDRGFNRKFRIMGYAVIQTGGKQYRVKDGDVLEVEKLDLEAGAKTVFNEVLLVGEGDSVKIGTPYVAGASVEVEVLEQTKADKVVAFKFKRRKGYHRTVGHRQKLTRIRVVSVAA